MPIGSVRDARIAFPSELPSSSGNRAAETSGHSGRGCYRTVGQPSDPDIYVTHIRAYWVIDGCFHKRPPAAVVMGHVRAAGLPCDVHGAVGAVRLTDQGRRTGSEKPVQ
jgi:hypothetical protein